MGITSPRLAFRAPCKLIFGDLQLRQTEFYSTFVDTAAEYVLILNRQEVREFGTALHSSSYLGVYNFASQRSMASAIDIEVEDVTFSNTKKSHLQRTGLYASLRLGLYNFVSHVLVPYLSTLEPRMSCFILGRSKTGAALQMQTRAPNLPILRLKSMDIVDSWHIRR